MKNAHESATVHSNPVPKDDHAAHQLMQQRATPRPITEEVRPLNLGVLAGPPPANPFDYSLRVNGNLIAGHVGGVPLTPETIRRSPAASSNELHTDIAAAEPGLVPREVCKVCDGRGAEPTSVGGGKSMPCQACNGAGTVIARKQGANSDDSPLMDELRNIKLSTDEKIEAGIPVNLPRAQREDLPSAAAVAREAGQPIDPHKGLILTMREGYRTELRTVDGALLGVVELAEFKSATTARVRFEFPPNVQIIGHHRRHKRVLTAEQLALVAESARPQFKTTCTECGNEVEYHPPYDAEPDTNVAAFPGGFECCGGKFELLNSVPDRPDRFDAE